MSKSRRTPRESGNRLSVVLMVLLGAAIGLYAGLRLLEAAEQVSSFGQYLLALAWMVAAAVFAVYAQLILHETGHLVCGLATGYKFCSFRIGSFQWQKENGRLRLRRMSLAGTGGQCLLAPPDLKDGKMPYVLYDLGGPLANLVTAALFALLSWACRRAWVLALQPTPLRAQLPMTRLGATAWMLTVLLDLLALVGLALGLMNGIPLRIRGLDNDGRNALSLGQDPAALRSLWVQLKVNEQQTCGVRLKEMPAAWFALPDEAGLANPMTATLAVLAENRRMDEHAFADAAKLIDELECKETALLGLYRNLLLCDRLYCALLAGENAEALLQRWDEKPMKAFRKQMKDYLTVLRTEYAVALLVERDTAKAEALSARFERRTKTHPFSADVVSERELMELVKEKEEASLIIE